MSEYQQGPTPQAPSQSHDRELPAPSGGGGGFAELQGSFGNAALVEMLGAGDPLPNDLQGELEQALGTSLGDVRIHADTQANALADGRGAAAFTEGHHIVFGSGRYAPGTPAGRHLLAHESAHVVQQTGSGGGASAGLEGEADSFSAAFATGSAEGVGVSAGASGPSPMHQGGDVNGPTVEELAVPVRNRLRELRGQGTEAVVAEVRSMRSQAQGDALVAINLAVEQVLTDAEKAVLAGREPTEEELAASAGQRAGGVEPVPEGGEGTTGSEEAEEQPAQQEGEGNEEGNAEGNQEGAQDGGGGGGATTPQGAVTTEQALQPLSALPDDQRAFIESELSFHESWQAMQGGTWSRAGQLLSADDFIEGGKGALIQTGAGLVLGQLAQRIPVPGLGNILGGAFSAYALFNGGFSSMTSDIGEALSFEGKGGWQIAADVVAGIKSLLDLIGNICNILSGLAYAFAAIAALGGLLSVFFPPLAFLVPYIPTAINFGRACGGIATVCLGISNLISPIPPVLRAIHILVSDQDPLELAYQEQRFHGEFAGALANYGNAALDQGIASGGSDFNPLNNFRGNIAGGMSATRSAGSDMANGNRDVRDAFQFEGRGQGMRTPGAEGTGRANGERFFGVEGNAARQTGLQETAQGRADGQTARADAHQARADALRPDNPNASRRARRPAMVQEANAERHRGHAARHQQTADTHGYRENVARGLHNGDVQGELGNTFEAAVGSGGTERESQAVEITRDEQGHVVLPTPPGAVGDVDALDEAIAEMQQALAAQQATTDQAGTIEAQAADQSTLLGGVEQGVQEHAAEHDALQTEHARVRQQQAEIEAQTAEELDQNDGGMTQAADVLRPWVGPAQTVNGVVQQVPSNRFFDVSGTQNNMNDFVTGMTDFTGGGEQAAEQRAETEQILAGREEQLAQAAEARSETQGSGQQLQAQLSGDRSEAQAVASEAGGQRQASAAREMSLQQQIEAKRAERESRWGALFSWAQTHYNTRETARRG